MCSHFRSSYRLAGPRDDAIAVVTLSFLMSLTFSSFRVWFPHSYSAWLCVCVCRQWPVIFFPQGAADEPPRVHSKLLVTLPGPRGECWRLWRCLYVALSNLLSKAGAYAEFFAVLICMERRGFYSVGHLPYLLRTLASTFSSVLMRPIV